jgi:hypothetical protein
MSAVSETETRPFVRGVVTLRARITAEGRVVDVVVEQARSVRARAERGAYQRGAERIANRGDSTEPKPTNRFACRTRTCLKKEIVDVETQIELPNGAIVRELSTKVEMSVLGSASQRQ